jgi:nucleotide-binding universal stress UspA family protein
MAEPTLHPPSPGTASAATPLLPGLACERVLCWIESLEQEEPTVELGRALTANAAGACHVVLGLDSPQRVPGLDRPEKAPLTPEVIARAEWWLGELYGKGVRTMVLPGNPVAEVRRYARRHQIDLIIMGAPALEVERRIGERLLDNAPCTILILIPPKPSVEQQRRRGE